MSFSALFSLTLLLSAASLLAYVVGLSTISHVIGAMGVIVATFNAYMTIKAK